MLVENALAEGSQITRKEYDQALHGWHTYFPLMPVAEQAVGEMATFFRSQLFPESAAPPAATTAPEGAGGAVGSS